MKAIIDGKLYDTERAEEIAKWDDRGPNPELDEVIEELYLTQNGNYFLYIHGGIVLEYEKKDGIKPLNEEEVKKWMEDTKNAEAYIEHFDYEEA